MAVDPNIKKKADDIRNKVYGKEVRESLASGLEAMSTDVVDTVGRQDEVEGQFQDVIDNTTDKDVISAPEIIAARDGEANLKARLDKEKNEVAAQLAQIERKFIDIHSTGGDDTSLVQTALSGLTGDVTVTFYGDFTLDYVLFENMVNVDVITKGTFKRKDGSTHTTSFFFINNVDNFTISTPLKIDGNALNNGGFGVHQQKHLVDIRHSENVNVHSIIGKNNMSDCVYLLNSKNVFIDFVSIVNDNLSGRNAVSVTSGENVFINSVFGHNIGVVGQPGGVDVEPNTAQDTVKNVHIKNIDVLSGGTNPISIMNPKAGTIDTVSLQGRAEKISGVGALTSDYLFLASNCSNIDIDIELIQTDDYPNLCRSATFSNVSGLKANVIVNRASTGVDFTRTNDFKAYIEMTDISNSALYFVSCNKGDVTVKHLKGFGYGTGNKNVISLLGAEINDLLIKGDLQKTTTQSDSIYLFNIPTATVKNNVRVDNANIRGYTEAELFYPNALIETVQGIDITNTLGYNNEFGTTAERPFISRYHKGVQYYDTDLKEMITWNGVRWQDHTGVLV